MKRKNCILLFLVLMVTITLTGCGGSNLNTERHLESGAIDAEYEGIPNPKLIVKMKLTPDEQAGNFEKVPIVTKSSKADLEAEIGEQMNNEEEGSDTPRPKI